MPDRDPQPGAPDPNPPQGRRTRRYLPPLVRYAIVGSWGAVLGVAVFYLLRKLGF